jgi:hypothetical protein
MKTKKECYDEIEKGKERITSEVCEKCYEHTLTYFHKVMAGEDLY